MRFESSTRASQKMSVQGQFNLNGMVGVFFGSIGVNPDGTFVA